MTTRYLVLHKPSNRRGPIVLAGELPPYTNEVPDGYYLVGDDLYYPHGTDAHPTLFKTLKMASKARRDGCTYVKRSDMELAKNSRWRPPEGGKILLFHPRYLPEVAADQILEHPGLADRESEIVIAERQMQLWADRIERLRAEENRSDSRLATGK